MPRIMSATVLLLSLVACSRQYIPLPVITPVISPSPLPLILTPTPPFIPSPTLAITILPISPTFTSTSTPTAIPLQPTNLTTEILGCSTSLDILHQMGEVTNAYPVVRNYTSNSLTNVCATLSASDEARVHPDKIACVAVLPAGFQVILKLTVDTDTEKDTSIQVIVHSSEGNTASIEQFSCLAVGIPGWVTDKVGVFEPIP